jgi:hypothetical protein
LRKRKKKWIEKKDTMNATRIPTRRRGKVSEDGIGFFTSASTVAPKIVGIARRKDASTIIFFGTERSEPKRMVDPERETPGMMLSIWRAPSVRNSRVVGSLSGRISSFSFIKMNPIPPMMSAYPIIVNDVKSVSIRGKRKNPAITIGSVPSIIFHHKVLDRMIVLKKYTHSASTAPLWIAIVSVSVIVV